MQKCEECGHVNLEGTMVCDECGFPLVRVAGGTVYFDSSTNEPVRTSGTSMLHEASDIVFEFVGFPDYLTISSFGRIVMGRADKGAGVTPDIDLTPYGAFEKGVSRTHAALIRQETTITLLDLESANGTLINGRRITANQPRVLQDGDEITFGQLVARIYFR